MSIMTISSVVVAMEMHIRVQFWSWVSMNENAIFFLPQIVSLKVYS
jgi:hypothetical protein